MGDSRKISLLLSDVDGTLLTDEKILTERARNAVLALKKKGIRFAITSGRPPRGMHMLVEPLQMEGPIVGFNGGMFVKDDLSIIEERPLPGDVARETVALMSKQGLDVWVYVGNEWLVRDQKAPHVEHEAWTVKFEPKVVANFDDHLDKAVKIAGVSDDHDLVQLAEQEAQGRLGSRASASRSQPYYLDVTHKLANKGAVADYLSRMFGIPAAEIATIGDQLNDVLMFKRSGFSIAMGNASDEVKKQAIAVTTAYDDEGFARAVETHFLGNAQ
jgi:Cof subfamily protein (haloacid dehalogenase superfamily)